MGKTKKICGLCFQVYVKLPQHLRFSHVVANREEFQLLVKYGSARASDPLRCPRCGKEKLWRLDKHLQEVHGVDDPAERHHITVTTKRRFFVEQLAALRATRPLIPMVSLLDQADDGGVADKDVPPNRRPEDDPAAGSAHQPGSSTQDDATVGATPEPSGSQRPTPSRPSMPSMPSLSPLSLRTRPSRSSMPSLSPWRLRTGPRLQNSPLQTQPPESVVRPPDPPLAAPSCLTNPRSAEGGQTSASRGAASSCQGCDRVRRDLELVANKLSALDKQVRYLEKKVERLSSASASAKTGEKLSEELRSTFHATHAVEAVGPSLAD